MYYINYIFTGFAVVMCLVMAYFAAFTNVFAGMKETQRQIFAIILISYAAFRVYRMIKSIKRDKLKQEEL